MNEMSVWASMQPHKPLNQNQGLGADLAKSIGAPKRVTTAPAETKSASNSGSSTDPGAGRKEEPVSEQTKLLYASRFSALATEKLPAAMSSIASAVMAKMNAIMDYAASFGASRSADTKAVDAQLATSRAEAAFDGANNKMAEDREMFKAIAKDRAQESSVETSTAAAGADDPESKIAKDREAIAAKREDRQSESMVLAAEAGGNGDTYNPTLDLTY